MKMTVANAQHMNEGRCDQCAGQCEVGKRCPRTVPTTEPGELAPDRETRPVRGSGVAIAVLLALGAACIGIALSVATKGGQP